ncbi:MAG: phytanoyl-CoA dioxygenase family protein [Lentisphaeria bacterium]|nr:phytanoyl-CoA dioxygenase family protein [Lentisphaeria bacterium]NQZ69020.1 phytanoyl-CoA dioxygenase family protein [Lentisphaeria bacterium]
MQEFKFPDIQGIKKAYDEDGFVIVREVFDLDFISEVNSHIDWLIEKHPDLETENLGHWLVTEDPFWYRFFSDDRLLKLAGALIGPNIALFAADYICKQPGTGRPLNWHQDAHYWTLKAMEIIAVWFAVTDSKRDNGCVRMIPGTHKGGLFDHVDSDSQNALHTQLPDSAVNEQEAVDIELEPGDISIHNPILIHGSNPNHSDRWRRGGSIQYMTPTTHIADPNWPSAFLLSGDAQEGINTYKPRPHFVEGEHMPFVGYKDYL